jgi:hypothetical protein
MRKIPSVLGLLFVLFAGNLYAGEPSTLDEATKSKVRQEIERYVTTDTQLKKSFLLIDPRTDRVLRLTFDHVHEGIMPHPKGYAACADFKDKSGKVYDVDIVVDATKEQVQVQEIHLHKVGGKKVAVAKTKGK